MKSCVLALMLLSVAGSVPTAFSAGSVQEDQAVSTPSPVPQGTTITGRVVEALLFAPGLLCHKDSAAALNSATEEARCLAAESAYISR